MLDYRALWPLLRRVPPELAHRAGLAVLRSPARPRYPAPRDELRRAGVRFRNRVGIAAGFDKDAEALEGIEGLGAGFVEVGTVLVAPWPGRSERPRAARLLDVEGIWNRLGFPSRGVQRVVRRLAAWPREARRGMVVAANIGPHPGRMRDAGSRAPEVARAELVELVRALHEHVELFVVNLSSPNTPGLRRLLSSGRFGPELVAAVAGELARLGGSAGARPVLVKLPPEDAEARPWTEASLAALVEPLAGLCAGFVAVNTSVRLALELAGGLTREGATGGVSGAPLFPAAREVVGLVRRIAGPEPLVVGCGGVLEVGDARALLEAGADLVEVYTGLVYRGPALVSRLAAGLATEEAAAAR